MKPRSGRGRSVAFTQPYIPAYRVPLFERVINALESERIDAHVYYGDRQERRASVRGDSASPEWGTRVPSFGVFTKFGSIYGRKLPRAERHPDVLVTDLAAANLDAWSAKMRRQPYILMGHGRVYTKSESKLSVLLQKALLRSAAHVLTYTDGGRNAVLNRVKIDPAKVTTFWNSTDTATLQTHLLKLTPQDSAAERDRIGIPRDGRVALFVGALEPYKEINLLLKAAKLAQKTAPNLFLLIAGTGSLAPVVESAARASAQIQYVGYCDVARLALLGSISEYIVSPGRVGLLAVDSLALGLPLLTTEYKYHAPEIEYLTRGENLLVAANTVYDLAELMRQGFQTPYTGGKAPSIEEAAGRISAAIRDVLSLQERSN